MHFDVDFSELKNLADKISASESKWTLRQKELSPVERFKIELAEGIELNLSDVAVNDSGLLTFKDLQVILYIPDHGASLEKALKVPKFGKKFHIADCKTLREMRLKRRYERYVATNDMTGNFKIYGTDDFGQKKEGVLRLKVCQNCLESLNYKNFRNLQYIQKKRVVDGFDIHEFFSKYSSYFEYLPQKQETESFGYDDKWDQISYDYRQSKNWECEKCGISLKDNKQLLHTHHINGVKHDNSKENLKALCIDCHSKEPGHNYIFVLRKYRQLIASLRFKLKKSHIREQDKSLLGEPFQWNEVLDMADPAVRGLIEMCRFNKHPVPEVGVDIFHGNSVYAQAELAWPDKKIAVVLLKDDHSDLMVKRGWKVYSVKEAMEDWFA